VARAVHLLISGRVHGVGYRAWLEDEATEHGLSGWVRNRRDGTVEAVIAGQAEAVEAMIALCRKGPRSAIVASVEVSDFTGPEPIGFAVLRTE